MILSNEGLELIKRFEGCRLSAYKCPAGVWTIGYGHTGNVNASTKITQETADYYLRSDVAKFENHVNMINVLYNYKFTQSQFDALVSFAFNIGNIKGLTNNGSRNKRTIADKMLLYNKANGKILDGLTKRRNAEHDLFIRDMGDNVTPKSLDDIVNEVMAGKWGNGNARKQKLIKAGYDYDAIQKRINEIKRG